MNTKYVIGMLGMLLVACGSDAATICSKLSECHDIPSGISKDSCEERFEGLGSDASRAQCAKCIDENTCQAIGTNACDTACDSFKTWTK